MKLRLFSPCPMSICVEAVELYCNKILPLYAKGAGQADDAGNWKNGDSVFIRNVPADFQPYSTELLKKDYGYNIEVTHRLFVPDASGIKIGMYFVEGDIKYEIRKIIPWDSYFEVMVYELP